MKPQKLKHYDNRHGKSRNPTQYEKVLCGCWHCLSAKDKKEHIRKKEHRKELIQYEHDFTRKPSNSNE